MLGEFGARAVRVNVTALSQKAVAALAAESGVDPDALYRQTNGNPFFVTEALAAGGEGVPETVRDAVLARAARLVMTRGSCSTRSLSFRRTSSGCCSTDSCRTRTRRSTNARLPECSAPP